MRASHPFSLLLSLIPFPGIIALLPLSTVLDNIEIRDGLQIYTRVWGYRFYNIDGRHKPWPGEQRHTQQCTRGHDTG